MLSSVLMDVFVIPLGAGRYALYCEPTAPAESDVAGADAPEGLIGRVRERFAGLVRAAEERHHRRSAPAAHGGDTPRASWLARQQDRIFGWVAQRVAEQRLLWNLRGHTAAVVAHPQDMTFEQVMALVRRILERDYSRHRLWTVLDGIAFVVTFILLGPFFLLVPGVANIPALYFGFRAIGHWLSMRGAAQGLHRVTWSGRPCPPLTELRDVAGLAPGDRDARVHDIAARLRLQHLSTFVESVSLRHA